MYNLSIKPFRVLLHPLWVGCLLVLVANDHWFKHAYPGWLSGKVSDFAGMLVAPWVLCALFRTRTRAAVAVAHGAIGVVFAAINLSSGAASVFSTITGWVGFPWRITVDWTDLIGLSMLGVSWAWLVPVASAAETGSPSSAWSQRVVSRLALIVGALACMATSPPDPDVVDGQIAVPLQTDAYLFNSTGISRVVRVRALADELILDCDLIASDPSGLLSRQVFGKAVAYQLFPESFLPLVRANNVNECTAYLIDGDGLPMRLLFWKQEDLPVITTGSTAPIGRVELVLQGTTGTALHLDPAFELDMIFPAPPLAPPLPPEGCAVPSAEQSIAWELPVPLGTRTLMDIQVAADGCAALTLAKGETESIQWFICLPYGMLALEPGDTVTITTPVAIGVSTVQVEWDSAVVKAAIGQSVVVLDGLNTAAALSEECGWTHDECGSLIRPLTVGATGFVSAVPTKITENPVKFDGEVATLVVTRAFAVGMSGTACIDSALGVLDHHIESVIFVTKED